MFGISDYDMDELLVGKNMIVNLMYVVDTGSMLVQDCVNARLVGSRVQAFGGGSSLVDGQSSLR